MALELQRSLDWCGGGGLGDNTWETGSKSTAAEATSMSPWQNTGGRKKKNTQDRCNTFMWAYQFAGALCKGCTRAQVRRRHCDGVMGTPTWLVAPHPALLILPHHAVWGCHLRFAAGHDVHVAALRHQRMAGEGKAACETCEKQKCACSFHECSSGSAS